MCVCARVCVCACICVHAGMRACLVSKSTCVTGIPHPAKTSADNVRMLMSPSECPQTPMHTQRDERKQDCGMRGRAQSEGKMSQR